MKELLYENFTNTIRELNQLSRFNKLEEKPREEILQNIQKANNLLNSSYSSLNLFFEAVKDYVSVDRQHTFIDEFPTKAQLENKRLSIIEIKSIFDCLLQILNNEYDNEIYTMDRIVVVESPIMALLFKFQRAKLNDEVVKLKNTTNFNEFSNENLKIAINTYVKGIEEYVDGILYYHINLLFTKPKIKLKELGKMNILIPKSKSYIDKWIDCEVTMSELHYLKEIDYWKEINNRKLDAETIKKIIKFQKKLFKTEVYNHIHLPYSEIMKTKKNKRLTFIKKEINLIERFLNGDTSIAHTKRLKNRFRLICSNYTLVKYDDLNLNKVADVDYVIYDKFEGRYSELFKAAFFIKYLKFLKKELKPKKKSSKNKKATPNTFKKLIPQSDKQAYILQLLENLSITTNGKSVLTPRKKGALRGVIEALKDKCIIPNKGIHTLCKIIAEEIQLELKSELDASTTSEKYKKEALTYIKNNPFR